MTTRIDQLLAHVAAVEGSDLHVKVGSPPRVRVNGTLLSIEGEAPLTVADLDGALARVIPDSARGGLADRGETDFAYTAPGVGRFRVNAFHQREAAAMVFRLVGASSLSFDDLGLPAAVGTLAEEHRGLVLVTGPTGSGKTTTLAAIIDHINRTRPCHIITIEDPIEVLHAEHRASICQREVGTDTASFAAAMRAAMRQDPDVILVGEMRDQETVAAALSAAETGHLVLSTLHTIDATETINRIVDFFPPYQQHQIRHAIAGSLKGTICQRLVPTADGGGRVAALEVMVVTGRIQQCIVEAGQTGQITEIIADGEYYGMQTFDQALAKLIGSGRIDLHAAMAAASRPHDLRVALQSSGLLGEPRRPAAPVGLDAELDREPVAST